MLAATLASQAPQVTYVSPRCSSAAESLASSRWRSQIAACVVERRLGLRGVPVLARLAVVHTAVQLRLRGSRLYEAIGAASREVSVYAGVVAWVHRQDSLVNFLSRRVSAPHRRTRGAGG